MELWKCTFRCSSTILIISEAFPRYFTPFSYFEARSCRYVYGFFIDFRAVRISGGTWPEKIGSVKTPDCT